MIFSSGIDHDCCVKVPLNQSLELSCFVSWYAE